MKCAFLALLLAAAACAQDGVAERGAALYRTHCATPYCHGPDGIAGRAPRLIGHRYNLNQMFKIVTWGIPGTGMPEFTTSLKTQEIADLVAYVMTLGGPSAAPAPAAAPRPLPPEARQGRALFFDASRTGACGSCHELDGWGVPVGPDLAAVPPDRLADMRTIDSRRMLTARPAHRRAAVPRGPGGPHRHPRARLRSHRTAPGHAHVRRRENRARSRQHMAPRAGGAHLQRPRAGNHRRISKVAREPVRMGRSRRRDDSWKCPSL
jgi:mono/diheme cytochrome c family protein